MLKYIINITFFILIWNVSAQKSNDSISLAKDSINYKHHPIKIRFSFDIGNFILSKYQNSKSLDFQFDTNFYKEYYLFLDLGYENHLTDNNLLNYNTSGEYFKLGAGYNLYDNWLDMNNDIIFSLKYGHAAFNNQLNYYMINQPDAIFQPSVIEVNKTFDGSSADWLEISTQIHVEIVKHLFLGYAVNIKYLIYSSDIQDFEITYIPGFKKKNSFSRFGFGIQYFISYQFKL